MLQGKRILLGISGGIAAYKTPELARLLIKQGADVKVVCTANALQFVTALTLETLTRHKVYADMFTGVPEYHTEHISLAEWADCLLVAPATADSIGKMAAGIADDALSTTYLACNKPVMVAPAMNTNMYIHPAVQANLQTLCQRGVRLIDPACGQLACGTSGQGRMAEPSDIVAEVIALLTPKTLEGKKILITAGPTYEKIDPVRFIGNYSSGKMGLALAGVCARHGAQVTLVCGPVRQAAQVAGVTRVDVTSADEMYRAATAAFSDMDAAILCAAVADFTPEQTASVKLKRGDDDLLLRLRPTQDIAAALGHAKRPGQVLVGFALETDHEQEHAKGKLQRKNLDCIVLNSLQVPGSCFGYDTNKICIIDRDGTVSDYDLKSKQEVAEDIVHHLAELLNQPHT